MQKEQQPTSRKTLETLFVESGIDALIIKSEPVKIRPDIETIIDRGIEYTTKKGKLFRVYRPFAHDQWFLMPMISVDNELLLDKERAEHVLMNGVPVIPSPNEYMDADDLRDYHNDDSFSGAARFSEQEINS